MKTSVLVMVALLGTPILSRAETVPYTERWDVKLRSLPPAEVLSQLDLTGPGLETAKSAADSGDRLGALRELRRYYRAKYPVAQPSAKTRPDRFDDADGIVRHVLQWGPYEPADYGKDINWEWDPANDIEWVAAVYRFFWSAPLANAYAATGDEKYAEAFVELTSDWIAKHPLEDRTKTHSVYTKWRGFAWLDLQTGIRATLICSAFKTLVHAEAFTPEFLEVLLASLYDHQVKTDTIPMGMVHNKAVFEQRGFVNVAHTFPEFRDAERWMKVGLDRARENLLAQVTPDGVQREWCGSYHRAVLRDAVELMQKVESAGLTVPADYRDCVRKMYYYIFAMATPDLGFPMFGDCARPLLQTNDRSRWPLYRTLIEATDLLGDPEYAARGQLDRAHLPQQLSYAFRDAGMYVMRSDWGPDQVYLALHCSPPGISGHDQRDNGTFELYAYGRWLMTDTGFYTYGHDAKARWWHRGTRVHQTLTLDGKDSQVDGKLRLWFTSPHLDALVIENQSYPDMLHRRTVWFVDRKLFVLLDEAVGKAAGTLDLHFQPAVGDTRIDPNRKLVTTGFDDANVLIWTDPAGPATLEEEEGWFAWEYGHRKARRAFRYRHASASPAAFLTLLVPYRGTKVPEVAAVFDGDHTVGEPEVRISVRAFGKTWRIGRHVTNRTAWSW